MRRPQDLIGRLARIGQTDSDTASERARKSLLVTVSLMVLPAAAIWGGMYVAFGEPVAALWPWAYFLASVCALAAFAANRSFTFLRTAVLGLILVIPFGLSLTLGGLVASSGVILWSFLAPTGALVFDQPRRAWGGFVAFAALLGASIPLAPLVRTDPVAMPDAVVLAFTALNIAGVTVIAFVLLIMFSRQRDDAQRRVEDLLLNMLPAEVAQRLQEQPEPIADHYEHVSVLFADVVDFTPLASGLPPNRVVDLLDRLFTEFDDLVDRYSLEKIKTIGDAYMVAAGVPRARPDHAQALAAAALGMRERASRHLREDDGRSLQVRIGINSGPVVAGVIGQRRLLFDLWGDTVNTASRMESHGAPGQIRITRTTWELIRDDFVCERFGTVEVKGKGPVEVWNLLGPRPGFDADTWVVRHTSEAR
jgi:adenylate cyclase